MNDLGTNVHLPGQLARRGGGFGANALYLLIIQHAGVHAGCGNLLATYKAGCRIHVHQAVALGNATILVSGAVRAHACAVAASRGDDDGMIGFRLLGWSLAGEQFQHQASHTDLAGRV